MREVPQIVVPLADVMVHVPGASAEEVEKQVATRLERLLLQIDGVEYVYSMSRPGMAVVTVRFYVGEDREDSLIKLYNKIAMNTDIVPPGVTGWVVKPIEIDDVPIVNVTLWSDRYNDHELRRVAEQVEIQLQAVPNTSRTEIVGGRRRQVTIRIDPEGLAAHNVTALQVSQVLQGANVNMRSGSFSRDNREVLVDSGSFLQSADEIGSLVVGVFTGRPVYVRDVATLHDGPKEPANYTRISFGPAAEPPRGEASQRSRDFPAVTIAVAKQKGTNAVNVARGLEQKLKDLEHEVIPSDVHVSITRNYGETANEKVNELVGELASAIVLVVGLIALTLGWREAIVVATAVPLTFSLTLLVNYLTGYTINRVTLFALILSLGLVVDDPIVDVENIFRHFKLRLQPPMDAVITAVNEVRPPVILATLAVIFSFLPLFFITGMMGPYMAPMALNVPIAMLMSMIVAFTITPWMSYHMLKGEYGKEAEPFVLERSLTFRLYSTIRQQGRISNRRRHARGNDGGNNGRSPAGVGRPVTRGARGDRSADVCRHRLADRLQWDGAALLLAPRTPCGRHPSEPAAEGPARAAKSRDPAAASELVAGRCESLRCEHETGRGSAGTTGDRHAHSGSLRAARPVVRGTSGWCEARAATVGNRKARGGRRRHHRGRPGEARLCSR